MGSEEQEKRRNVLIFINTLPLRQKMIILIPVVTGALLLIFTSQDVDGYTSGINLYSLMDSDYSVPIEALQYDDKDNYSYEEANEFMNSLDVDDLNYEGLSSGEMASPENLLRFRKANIFNRLITDGGDDGLEIAAALYNTTSPQYKAFHFISEFDKRNVHPDDDLLIQRYALAVIYYATKGQNWRYGNFHFLSGVHECHWYKKIHSSVMGVAACDANQHVTHLQLSGNNLEGTLPSEIKFLKRLEKLDLGNNILTGTIPSEISQLSEMIYLSLNTNDFTGTIPDGIGQMKNAEEMLLQFNSLAGEVPESICDLKENKLYNLWTDCASIVPPLYCSCCSICCDGYDNCGKV